MKTKNTHYENPWLLGQEAVCQFLGGLDKRTYRKYLSGLEPRVSRGGKFNLYHKDDVDQFLETINLKCAIIKPVKR